MKRWRLICIKCKKPWTYHGKSRPCPHCGSSFSLYKLGGRDRLVGTVYGTKPREG